MRGKRRDRAGKGEGGEVRGGKVNPVNSEKREAVGGRS